MLSKTSSKLPSSPHLLHQEAHTGVLQRLRQRSIAAQGGGLHARDAHAGVGELPPQAIRQGADEGHGPREGTGPGHPQGGPLGGADEKDPTPPGLQHVFPEEATQDRGGANVQRQHLVQVIHPLLQKVAGVGILIRTHEENAHI